MRVKRELRKLSASFRAAFNGIGLAVKNERNFRIHICFIFYVLIFACLGSVPADRCAILVLCFGIVTAAELVNSAIELLGDTVTDRFDMALRAIKDMASGAVLMSALCSAVAGLVIFLAPDVLSKVFERLLAMPYIAGAIVLSLPVAVLFVVRRSK